MNHYFMNTVDLKSDEKEIFAEFRGNKLRFITDNGVFAKNGADKESLILAETVEEMSGSVLDLGCGYGLVGIALKKAFNDVKMTQSDVNERAVKLCKKNAALNNAETDAIVSDKFTNIHEKFDIILLNPPIHAGKAVVYALYEESAGFLSKNGELRIVIAEKHGAPSTIKKLEEIYSKCTIIYKKKGIFVISARV